MKGTVNANNVLVSMKKKYNAALDEARKSDGEVRKCYEYKAAGISECITVLSLAARAAEKAEKGDDLDPVDLKKAKK